MPRLRIFIAILAVLGFVAAPASAVMSTSAEHAILMDGATGQVLWAKDGFSPMPPASMSKLMTVEILFSRIKDGRVKLTDRFPVSERAWRERSGSTMFVKVGDTVAVEDLIRGIITQSGNDACIVVAEALGGTVEGFVDIMNKRAKELGLGASHFVNPDGLDVPPGQRMSAYDLAKLARQLIYSYPNLYHFFSDRQFTFNGITQHNRNLVLDRFPGTDGLKTGHLEESGYGITVSAVQGGQRLILVINGLRYPDLTGKAADWFAERRRADEAARVLGMGFREFRSYQLFKANEIAGTVPVWGGSQKTVPVTTGKPLAVTLQVDSRQKMVVAIKATAPVNAPIKKGQQVGTLTVTAPDFPTLNVPLYAAEDVGRQNIFARMFTGIKALFGGAK
ncbi:D-alanyl-D-alanine carboxypeptidase family protein [Rhizomicrobium electricum]|jgi:D-alanyl-D-alanine carboxypeptidase (penicillin-binding protein 5/6)|uniref:serine-type D-Ala-D-Ala carboxypeptidase n=1 Tax=Rhizomicrobium electricum TaxID=480070 RepID=A0ABN1F0F0_9PROT|nr:D-alanyl-D-alanine carboxypeptidase family protein [Rhizomicrobium electricum]NIJ50183.1 D-alanyl-D-alanine carboxypeptidase (penicillin-binding protein 5/6) [Rhizomicrobium electricum]